MEVILIKDIENLGYANDIVNVKPGYANNYLIPQGYAKAATAAAKKILAENLKQRAHKDAKILADAQALAEKIANLPLVIAAKAEEGRIFGAITAARRGFGCQRNRNRPQDHCRGEHQDPRRIRGRRQDSPRRQSDDQIYGNRRGVIPSLRFNRKGRSYRSAFFVGSPERKTAPACPPPSRNPEISIGKNKKIATFANGCGPGRRRRPRQTDARRIRSRRNSRFGAMHGREHSVPTPQKDPARLASHMRYCPDRNPNVRTPHA